MTDNAAPKGVAIRETTVTQDATGPLVQLHISDVAPPYEDARLLLHLTVRLPQYRPFALVAQVERQAMDIARIALRDLIHSATQEISIAPDDLSRHLDPVPKGL